MKIAINSRVYQNYKTGIPYYIKRLYSTLIEIDKINKYIFFQTDDTRKISITKTVNTFKNLIGDFLFDNLLINKLVVREKIDVFHGPAYVLPFFKKRGVKYVLTIHDLSFLFFPKHYSKRHTMYYKYFVRRSLHNADIIITDSNNTKKDIKTIYNIPDDKIKVVYLGISDNFSNASKKERLINYKYFFSLTTQPNRKNILSVLDVMYKDKKLQKYKYVIAGKISNIHMLELINKIKKLQLENNVILFGYATEEELISLYQNAEFFIYPSFYEGFGFPVLEAMACKCPVITSNNSSLVEITPNKKWLVDPYNLEDISNKMYKMLHLSDKERYELVEDNYIFSKRFTWEKTAKEYINIFNQTHL